MDSCGMNFIKYVLFIFNLLFARFAAASLPNMDSCGMNFIKYVLFIFNLLFAISGIGLIAAGATVLSDVGEFNFFVDSQLVAPPIILIVAGAVVFIVAFLGCFGAIRESYGILMAFAVCLLVIFILELAAGIAAAVYKGEFQDVLKTTLRDSLANYSNSKIEQNAWNTVQTKLKCCGVTGPHDWQGQSTPQTCCHNDESRGEPYTNYCNDQGYGLYLYHTGCYDKIKDKFQSNSTVSIGVGIGIAFIEIVGIVLACWLAHKIKTEGGSK